MWILLCKRRRERVRLKVWTCRRGLSVSARKTVVQMNKPRACIHSYFHCNTTATIANICVLGYFHKQAIFLLRAAGLFFQLVFVLVKHQSYISLGPIIRLTQPIWLWVQAYLDGGSYCDHQDDYDDGESIGGVALDDTLPPTRGKFAPSPISL